MRLQRLLLVSEPGRDGVFDYVRSLVAHFRKYHPEVIIDFAYSSKRSGPPLQKLVGELHRYGGETVDLNIGNAPQPGDMRATWEILRLIRAHRPQVIHCHSSKAGALCRGLSLIWPDLPPVVYSPHAYYGLGGKKSLPSLIFNTLEKIFGRVGFTINISSDERNFAIRQLGLSPRRLVLINNGIDLERFHPTAPSEKRVQRAAFGLPENGPVLISIGRDSFQKNYPPLYAAMNCILSDPAATVFFAHAGSGAEALEAGLDPVAQKRCRAFNHLDHVENLFHAADAFILTSRYEGLSLGALQALGSNLKVFLTRVTGNACLGRIGFGDITWIEPAGDTAQMATRIEAALRAWLAQAAPPGEQQQVVARRSIDMRIQLEKVYRLYSHLVRTRFD